MLRGFYGHTSKEAMPARFNIGVVEDHADLRELYVDFLRGAGFEVVGCCCAEELDEFLGAHAADLLILDVNLPGEDGFSICRRMREAHPDLYLVLLTARVSVDDRVQGYDSGADIFLSKPVTPRELDAVVRGLARRRACGGGRSQSLILDMEKLTFSGEKGVTCLVQAEAAILRALCEAPERTLEYWRLLELLGLDPDERGKAVLEVRVSRLKKKIEADVQSGPFIKALRREGYRLCRAVRVVG